MGLWVYGSMGLWVYGFMGLWVYGFMGLWVYGFMGLWVYGFMGLWVYGFMRLWVYGFMGLGFRVQDLGFRVQQLISSCDGEVPTHPPRESRNIKIIHTYHLRRFVPCPLRVVPKSLEFMYIYTYI